MDYTCKDFLCVRFETVRAAGFRRRLVANWRFARHKTRNLAQIWRSLARLRRQKQAVALDACFLPIGRRLPQEVRPGAGYFLGGHFCKKASTAWGPIITLDSNSPFCWLKTMLPPASSTANTGTPMIP